MTSEPPPWRNANATTSAAPKIDAIQNNGFGRSWVMRTATNAVAIGRMPSTTPPCEASTVWTPSAIRNGNITLTQSIATASGNHSRRGGSGRRNTINSASEHSPAIAVRSAVSASGSIAETAIRVAGSVPPKIAMPMKPSTRPRRSRDHAGEVSCDSEGEDIAGFLTFSRSRVQRWRVPHGGHASRCVSARRRW